MYYTNRRMGMRHKWNQIMEKVWIQHEHYFSYSTSGQHFCSDTTDSAHSHNGYGELSDPLIVVHNSHTFQSHETTAEEITLTNTMYYT